jgi:hypothetical protein
MRRSSWHDTGFAPGCPHSAGASFLAWLLETRGAAQLRAVYYAKSSEFAARFATVYGRSLEDTETDWLAFCNRVGR